MQKITNVASKRNFKIELIEVEPKQQIKFSGYSASTFKMEHTLPCIGYRVTCPDGKILAYTGDTMLCEALKALGENADLFVHEATYLHKDSRTRKAAQTFYSPASRDSGESLRRQGNLY